ncbi:hypothetical protein [Aeromicrobium sp. Leaf291]|uniref:hypothetical protein n=1 Tax=Aeromicrobium sp. Leaf291 TaxID=1736325 RepID=UPI0006FBD8E6|nr:hypothetical protein [Aeromicrobium sp. Leaf291]KQP81570.1 hypothetical protein ASF35_16195 [Aeromicrobium sp. Leaf291]
MSTTSTKKATTDASVADEVWATKREKLRRRGRKTRHFDFLDEDLEAELEQAQNVVGVAELACRKATEAQHADSTHAVREKAVADALRANRKVTSARKKLTLAQKKRDEGTVRIYLRGLGSDVYDALVSEHPPTDADRAKGRDYALATFAPALVAACSLDDMTEEDAADLIASLSQGESSLLFATAVEVNQVAQVSLGKG